MAQFDGIRIVASVPGRLRIEVPGLYRSPATSAALERQVAAHAMVCSVRANPLTARLLILFQPQCEAAILLAELGLAAGPASAVAAVPAERSHSPLYAAWHAREADEALAFFGSSAQRGLSRAEAARRLALGANLIVQPPALSAWQILLHQFTSLPIVLLGVSACVSVLTGGAAEAAAIGAVLVLNGAIGFDTERRAEATVASLAELVDDVALAVRDGVLCRLDAAQLVAGDLVLLAPGTRIAADLRLLAAQDLMVDESALTGESYPVPKQAQRVRGAKALAERSNMAYRGTAVAAGSGRGLVVGTGMRTEVGAIAALTHAAGRPKTPVQQQLDQLSARLIAVSCALCGAVFFLGLLRGHGRLAMFKSALALAIAAVPEGLPAVATTALARGIHRMRERKVLIRHLHAVETIGAIHTICLDKTGTLTRNQMSAVALATLGPPIAPDALDADCAARLPALYQLLQVCVLCQESGPGSATESALMALAERGSITAALRAGYPLVTAALRAEGRNFMRTVHQRPGGGLRVAVKGSPDEVLALCGSVLRGGAVQPLDAATRAVVAQQNAQMARQQLRVLGFAQAQLAAGAQGDTPLTWLGLVGLADPLRPKMAQVIARFHQAGIATIMLTGDQAATAREIGAALHLNNGAQLNIVNAEQLDALAPQQLQRLAASAHIFARVTPSDKLRIVKALQQGGQTVAMTGDGINDGPALRAADIGIAMGGGTDLALSAADIVLKTDELGRLLEAVSQGRSIAANIGKAVHFLVSSNLSEILLVAGAVASGLGQPLTPLQVLWLNLLTDVLPAIALAAEAPEPDVMARPPRAAGQAIVGHPQLWRYAREAAVLAGGAFAAYGYGVARHGAGARAGTIAFDTLVLSQMLHALLCRSERQRGSGDAPLPANRQLMLAIVASLGLQAGAHLVPGLRRLLGIAPLGAADLAVIAGGALLPMLLNALGKPGAHSRAATRAMAERSTSLPTSPDAMPAPRLRPSSLPGLGA